MGSISSGSGTRPVTFRSQPTNDSPATTHLAHLVGQEPHVAIFDPHHRYVLAGGVDRVLLVAAAAAAAVAAAAQVVIV